MEEDRLDLEAAQLDFKGVRLVSEVPSDVESVQLKTVHINVVI